MTDDFTPDNDRRTDGAKARLSGAGNSEWVVNNPLRVSQGLLDARATMQRLSDSKIARGWIVGVQETMINVRSTNDPPLEMGERFAVRTTRLNGDVAFIAELIGAAAPVAQDMLYRASRGDRPKLLSFGERTYTLKVIGQMYALPASGDARYQCAPSRVLVNGAEAEVRDISPEGMGIVCVAAFEAGQMVEVRLDTAIGPWIILAEARYCRAYEADPPAYRIGVHFDIEDRIEKARWMACVRDRAIFTARSRLPNFDGVTEMSVPLPEETGVTFACHTLAPELVRPWGKNGAPRAVQIDPAPPTPIEVEAPPVVELVEAPTPAPKVVDPPTPPADMDGPADPYREADLWDGPQSLFG